MTKQYRLFYKRAGAQNWGNVEPGIHSALYDVPPVNEAIQVLRDHPSIHGVVAVHEGAYFNLMVFEQEAIAPKAIILFPETPA